MRLKIKDDGFRVKHPRAMDLDHEFLWRATQYLPISQVSLVKQSFRRSNFTLGLVTFGE